MTWLLKRNQIDTKEGPKIPEKKIDISKLMDDIYTDVINYLDNEELEKVAFSDLVPGEERHHKIHTFLPLLHLTNARKTDLEQHKHFGEIWVKKVTEETKKAMMEQIQKEERA